MRWLINYIRSCFCCHDWERIGRVEVQRYTKKKDHTYNRITYRCKKCGFVQRMKI